MSDLIERLEAAKEGSRELDAEIGREIRTPDWRKLVGIMEVPIGHKDLVRDARAADFLPENPPHYTQSLDAALTLVPEDERWEVQHDLTCTWASIGEQPPTIRAKTPALALCIAALKARAAKEGAA